MGQEPETLITWAVRAVSERNRDRVLAASRQHNLGAGPMLDRMIDHWFDDGAPMAMAQPAPAPAAPPVTAEGMAALVQAALAAASAAAVPVPASFASAVMADARRAMKQRRQTGIAPSHDAVAQSKPHQLVPPAPAKGRLNGGQTPAEGASDSA
jgi:hypothetical protein